MQTKWEKYYPLIIAVVATGSAIKYNHIFKDLPGLIDKLSDNAIGIATTLAGFFLTILTIINAIDTRRMRFVREMGLFPRLLKYLNQSIKANVVLIAISFIAKYIEHRDKSWLSICGRNIPDYIYLFIFILALLISIRFINIFVRLLTDIKVD